MGKLFTQRILLILSLFSLLAGSAGAQTGTWTLVNNMPPDPNNGVMLLLTNGTVMCHTNAGGNLGDGTIWDILTPDSTGSYVNGTWTQSAPMNQERYSFSSQILNNGSLYAAGGEYGTDGTQAGYHVEVYDPVANTWTEATGTSVPNIISDGSCQMLDNGDVLQALVDVPMPVHCEFYTPSTNAMTTAPSTINGQNESIWLKLPDNSILFVDEGAQTSERYIPSLNQWVADGNVPVALYDQWGYECGPAWMLPDGRAFFIGSTGNTAYYTPSGNNNPGTWAAGPNVPSINIPGQGLTPFGMPDAPGAMMVNGHILFAASPAPTAQNEFSNPTEFFEFNYTTNTYTLVSLPTPDTLNTISQNYNMLVLPNGQVLLGINQDGNGSYQYYIYTPAGAPLAAGKPTINHVNRLSCTTYMATGHLFNGISEGSAFGDENENSTNYPIFQFTQGGKVYYARSYNWNSRGVQRGTANDTAYFELPAGMGSGAYNLYAIANGISSNSFAFTDSVPTLSSNLSPSVCSGATFTYTPTSTTVGATYTWTRAAVTGISNAAITNPQASNPNEILHNTTNAPITVIYAYEVTGDGCTNEVNVFVTVNPPPTAGFTGNPTSGCALPDTITFTNTSLAGTTYHWYFGDGGTSTAVNPVYAYNTGGNFSVKLVVTSACGADSITQAGYISINPPAAPTVTSPVSASCGGTATLHASGSDTLRWFHQATGGTQVGTGTTFVTPGLSGSTTYYVESDVPPTPDYCPPTSNAGTGGYYQYAYFRADIFNVNQACTLKSVVVYGQNGGVGYRTINLEDGQGNILQTTTVNIPSGQSTVTLNFPLTPGIGYQLGCGDGVNDTYLYRNSGGVNFPYTDPNGYITITGNDVQDNTHFYYFYDWKLVTPDCVSPRTPVNVVVPNSFNVTSNTTQPSCHGGTNGSATVHVSAGTGITYHWSNGGVDSTISNIPAGTYTVTITSSGGCSDTATVTVSQPSQITSTAAPRSICAGTTYSFGTHILSAAGTYYDTLTSVHGCDSIVSLTLSVLPIATQSISQSICHGGSYPFGGHNLSAAGTYRDTLIGAAANGCDSVITLTLSFLPNAAGSISRGICTGRTYSFGGHNLSVAGTYTDTLTGAAANGCDSIVTLNLSVNSFISTGISDSICQGGSIFFNGKNRTTAGAYVDTLASVGGCDSIVTLTLTVNPLPAVTFVQSDTSWDITSGSAPALTGGSPAGGTYTGPFVTADSIIAAVIGVNHDTAFTVAYTYTDGSGCVATASHIFIAYSTTGISQIGGQSSMRLYPNPNSGTFTLQTSSSIGKDYVISDLLGQIITRQAIKSDIQVIDLPAEAVEDIYILTVDGEQPLRFVVVRQ